VHELVHLPIGPLDLSLTLSCLSRGRGDPCHRSDASGVWRTWRTPEGAATVRLERRGPAVRAVAWGPGADWALAAVPDLLGGRDDPGAFRPAHPLLRELVRRYRGLRVPRSGLVFEALVPAILEQKVTGVEARRAWRYLINRYGEPAPGPAPAGMRVFPVPSLWRRIPSWEWHRAGVDGKRSRTVLAAAEVADALERTLRLPAADVLGALRSVPGIGAWTAAEVAQRAHGDADAVSVGDYHLPAVVGWALIGRPVDDDGMLDLLAPYAGHRHRAVRLLEVGGPAKPRFGARLTPRDMRAI
jgi:3-methyladenine DNA glycosylase/8-oxoguanine DNA glycosylase